MADTIAYLTNVFFVAAALGWEIVGLPGGTNA